MGIQEGSGGVSGPERLRVYHLAQRLVASVEQIARRLGRRAALADQLRRAADSVVLNIAEGAAHYSPGRKAYHYQLARGSASECIAALTIVDRLRSSDEARRARATANLVCAMLTRLIRSQENRK